MTTVAVIGGGAAGIGAAETLLSAGMDVILFEAGARVGGNCIGIDIPDQHGGLHRVDAGVSDFNRTTFVEVARLIDGLGLPTRPIAEDTNFVSTAGHNLWSCQGGRWSFRRPVRGTKGMPEEVLWFRARAMEVLEDDRFADWSAERYLRYIVASPAFRRFVFYPRAIGCFPMPNCAPHDYNIRQLVRFWHMHGIVSRDPADRHCVVGGMHRYARVWQDRFVMQGGELHCRTRVLGVSRGKWSVAIRTVDHRDRHRTFKVSHVVMANNAHDVKPILEDPTPQERFCLGRFHYQRARIVVHTDERFMGSDRDAWGAFNYVVPDGELPRVRPTITFFPNKLGSLPPEVPEVFVTMNPHLEPRAESVIANRFFMHPVAGRSTEGAITGVRRIQGAHRTWFAGSYLVEPFVHESALVSGIRAAKRLLQLEQGKLWIEDYRSRRTNLAAAV